MKWRGNDVGIESIRTGSRKWIWKYMLCACLRLDSLSHCSLILISMSHHDTARSCQLRHLRSIYCSFGLLGTHTAYSTSNWSSGCAGCVGCAQLHWLPWLRQLRHLRSIYCSLGFWGPILPIVLRIGALAALPEIGPAARSCVDGTDARSCVFKTVTFTPKLGYLCSWWRHQMETFSALLAICAGNSPVPKRPVTRSFDVFFNLRLNKRLSKQSWCW